jgi:hypothetical protein
MFRFILTIASMGVAVALALVPLHSGFDGLNPASK